MKLLRFLIDEMREPVLFLCIYRPTFSLLASHQAQALGDAYYELRLEDLALSEAQSMVESLLNTDQVPAELKKFIQKKVEGNPFYLEEMINSMIESGALIEGENGWQITRSIQDAEVSSTIQGVIAGRLDRLESKSKRILQEASVIGRAFLYDILYSVTNMQDKLDKCLSGLERFQLIRPRSLEPDLEYIFKHALTQEVVYNGLLKKERRLIHERVGRVIEEVFHDRLPEFYESLAHHFARGQSIDKAIDYLAKSGEKSLKRFALEEADQNYRIAFGLVVNQLDESDRKNELVIDIILNWALVFNCGLERWLGWAL
ncbi:MAG: hypothetical protein KQI62_02705 [Deltaproteobacteria bacterium]|nr:hypothetical protein [Deltaproteobacteria bacterium]